MKETLIKLGIVAALIAGAYAVGRYLQPNKVVTKVETVVKEVAVVKKDVQIIEKETKLKDGTIIKETTTIDKSQETTKKEDTTKSSVTVENSKPQWKVHGLAEKLNKEITNPTYGVLIERRILGPAWVGVKYNTQSELGISIGVEF